MTPLMVFESKIYTSVTIDRTERENNTKKMVKLLEDIYENNWHLNRKKRNQTLLCLSDPVSLQLFEDPLIASDGITYSRSTLEQLIARSANPRSPINRYILVKINGDVGIKNILVSSLVEKYSGGDIAIY